MNVYYVYADVFAKLLPVAAQCNMQQLVLLSRDADVVNSLRNKHEQREIPEVL